ncbi:MAG: hypothetical protein EBT80_10275 [Chitinophagales bacterium]|nr:hypothetical protein [Chitinophagales bacterium]
MSEQMTEEQVLFQERKNTGTAKTNNQEFEKNGYLVIKNLWDSQELYRPVPQERGQINYWGKRLDQFNYTEVEQQVEGSLACYWHPQYRYIHSGIRLKLEKVLGNKLYNTYYYDRFYFPGQELTRHADRDACEISVTVHISSNLQEPWPIWIKTPDTYVDEKKTQVLVAGENRSVILNAGDGMIYKGCERPHWRYPMPTEYTKTWYGRKVEKEGLYYHQIFFHYVLANGQRAHCANDMAR